MMRRLPGTLALLTCPPEAAGYPRCSPTSDNASSSVPAALVESATSSMLRAVAQALGSSSPGEVLAQVNETLLARIPPNMFVTCFYAIVEDESGGLLYANAGHNLPCCRRDDEHAAATTTTDLSARGMPLGIMPQ